MHNSLSSADERPARSVFVSSLACASGVSQQMLTRIYHMPHPNVAFHTHIGRYTLEGLNNRRIDWVSMTVEDLSFVSITRREVAQALWPYRHDPQLTITELRFAAQ